MPGETTPGIAGRTVNCLLFDIGETLWTRLNKATLRSLNHLSEQRAIALLYERIPPAKRPSSDSMRLGERLRQTVDEYTHQAADVTPGYEPDFVLATQRALHELGFAEVDSTLSGKVFEALRVRSSASRHVFDDVFPTMIELHKRGFRLGIVTNRQYGGKPFEDDLRELGFLNHFALPSIAISADLGIRKPNPDIFRHALRALDVAPEEAAMIGDSLHADVGGSKPLHMLAIWKPKLSLRAAAQAALLAQYVMHPLPQEIAPLNTEDALSTHAPEIDDNYLIQYAQRHDKSWAKHPNLSTRPDIIIEHTKDLLEIFAKAGKQ